MTIDLGFAWLKLPSGRDVSLVDVPGHERFIKNMLAGVGGMDLALLVVAADEGIMPQTREHLAIIDLLKIRSGVVAITKSDLVDEEWIALVRADVEEALLGTSVEGSPLVTCSTVTRAGLPELLAALDLQLDVTPPKRDIQRPRLSIDRAFTISGFGAVVTGTLLDGSLHVGQEVEVLPEGLRARVRGLQMHRQKVEETVPGSRAAVNLAGISTDELRRGMLLTTPGWLQPTSVADTWLTAVRGLSKPVKHNLTVTFHTGAAEAAAKLRLLDRNQLEPGHSCWAQVRLAEPLALVKGDSFIIRTPNDTVAGGSVVDVHPRRHRRGQEATLRALDAMAQGSPEESLLSLLAKLQPAGAGRLTQESDLGAAKIRESLADLAERGDVVRFGEGEDAVYYTRDGHRQVSEAAQQTIDRYFAEYPLRVGMQREELKSRLGLRPRLFNDLVSQWIAHGMLVEHGALLGLPGRRVTLNRAQEQAAAAFLAALRAAPHAPPAASLPEPALLAYLAERGDVVPVAEGVVFSADAYREMTDKIITHIQLEGSVTLAQVRDFLGTSRKYTQALLEHLDERHVTRRVGDERVLRSPEAMRR